MTASSAYPPADLQGAVIAFDLDGTLVETAPDLIGALNVVLGELGLPHVPVASARALVGQGARKLIERGFAAAGRPLDEAEIGGLVARFIAAYRARIADESHPYPGLIETLDELRAAGAILCVCTNKRSDLSLALLDALNLTHRFAAIVGADRAPRPKPDPSHVLAAIAAAGGDPAFALMVGDSSNDVDSAKAANVPVVAVTFGYTQTPARDLGADAAIDRFDELPAVARRLLGASAERLQPTAPSAIASAS
jgi:phosphoglycolate phosphatase